MLKILRIGYLLFLCVYLLLSCNKSTSALLPETSNLSDTYQGFRLAYVHLSSNQEKETINVSGTLVNTGRYSIALPPRATEKLVVNFDNSLMTQGLANLSNPIKQSLLQKNLSLEPGEMIPNLALSVVGQKSESTIIEEEPLLADKGENLPFEERCPDLQIDTFFVSKRTKKYAEISFKIVNIGKDAAALYGTTKELADNVAIRAYASGTPKLSRGDLIIGGAYIEKGIKNEQGLLPPNESYTGAFRVDIRKKTRHMPYLIIAIDDYQQLWECDERNNVKHLLYR